MYDSSDPVSHTSSRAVDPFHELLDDLYRFAQALTLDELSAATLVEETCHRAAASFPSDLKPLDRTQQLFELLARTYREEYATKTPGEAASSAATEPTPAQEQAPQFRRRMADQVLDRLLPVAITALPDEDRALVVLCGLEELTCAQAAGVLGMDPETSCRRLETAHRQLLAAVQVGVSESERQLLASSLAPDLLPERVKQILRRELAPMPPALRMSVDDILAPGRSEIVAFPERKPAEPVRASRWGGTRAGSVLVVLGLILVTGLIAYLASEYTRPPASMDLVTLAATGAGKAQVLLETENPEQAERFVQVHFGLRLTVPDIDQAVLKGVGIEEVAPGVRLPAFVYRDSETERDIVLFAYSYALLDRNKQHVSLAADVRSQIEDDNHFDIHDLGTSRVLVFRNRDDIFFAVTQGDPEALQQRIVFPS